MTKVLNLALMGPILMKIDEEPLDSLVSTKAQAILSYLVFQKRPLPRQTIATLFWGDMLEEDARRNLRGVVMKLRSALDPYLYIDNTTIGFDFQSDYLLDIEQIEQGVKVGTVEALETAVSLYRGEFLAEFVVRDAPEFESWQERERARLHQLVLQAHDKLLGMYERKRQFAQGIHVARLLIEIEPTREASHRHLIRLLAQNGQGDTAVDQFETLRTLLEKELQVEPSADTRQLLQEIRQGAMFIPPSVTPTAPVFQQAESVSQPPPFLAGPPITFPARFFGREAIVKRLFRLFQKRPFQNAAIIGPRRSGKTSLLHYIKSITLAQANQKRTDQRHDWLNTPQAYRWVFVDFQDARFGELPRLLSHMLKEMGLPAPNDCDLDEFLDIVADNLQQPTIILFDEIGVALSRYTDSLDDAFWESLRSLATNQVDGKLGFILSSHEQPSELAIHNGYGSPFFNIFGYTAVLGPFKETEARQLINSSPIPFPPEDADWIVDQSQLWPMPLQILCRERLLTLEDGELDDEWREEALRQVSQFLPKDNE